MVWRSLTIEFQMFHRNISINTSFRHYVDYTWSSSCWHFTLSQREVILGRIASSSRTTWMSKTLWKELVATVLKCKSSTIPSILFVPLLAFQELLDIVIKVDSLYFLILSVTVVQLTERRINKRNKSEGSYRVNWYW